jgi:hypothetical protein
MKEWTSTEKIFVTFKHAQSLVNGDTQFKINPSFMHHDMHLIQNKSNNHSAVGIILSSSGYVRIPVDVTEVI